MILVVRLWSLCIRVYLITCLRMLHCSVFTNTLTSPKPSPFFFSFFFGGIDQLRFMEIVQAVCKREVSAVPISFIRSWNSSWLSLRNLIELGLGIMLSRFKRLGWSRVFTVSFMFLSEILRNVWLKAKQDGIIWVTLYNTFSFHKIFKVRVIKNQAKLI